MKYLKLFESFGFSREINPDILTREQFESLSRQSIHMRFSSKTTIGLTMNVRKTGININYDSKVKQHIMFYFNYSYLDAKMVFNTKFSIMKTEGDEPFVYFDARYGYRNIGTDYWEYQKYPHDDSIYGRMEVEEFDQIIANPKLWKDWMVDKTFELDQQTHKILKESLFDIPDPEPMDANEWNNEVNNAKEPLKFTQKEKELFISLSDKISVKNKINQPEIGNFYMLFQLINGDLNPKIRNSTIIRSFTTYKSDDEFYYVENWDRDNGDNKLYRCDGYECWEKFLKEIFKGYRELVNKQSKTNESYFDEVPEPELMDLNEWDEEVVDAKEPLDFTQKEKELFISLSDTISAKHKIDLDALEIGDSQLSFSMVNGHDGIYPNLRSTTVIRSLTSYKNDDEFYYVNVWEGNDIDGETKSYRCDGYECWEKFLKEIFAGYRKLINNETKTNESVFDEVPEPEKLSGNQWDEELDKMVEAKFDQRDIDLFVSLSDSIPNEWKKKKTLFNYFEFHFGRHGISGLVWLCKTDDDYYLVEVWNRISNENTDSELYKCDGFESMEKLLRKTFDGFREIISMRKTNESMFDEVPEPKSLLDENGDITQELSSEFEDREREPFTKSEKLFINKLVETLNKDWIRSNYIDQNDPLRPELLSGFLLSMGDMAETTHILRVLKYTDEYYGVEFENYLDYDDGYMICECDGFDCLSKLLIELFEKINKDYDYEGN